ncbi:MAG: glycosyltransferase family 39 protein [Candidatus Nealsonbacteria bacterium]
MFKSSKRVVFLVLLILILASFFRLWQINEIPPGIYPDEAMNANQAVISPGEIFYPENNGREGFFVNLAWLSFSVFGVSVWSFKLISALAGILTVFGIYLLAKELFNNSEKLALFSSFFLAVSFWHVNFSRIGFRAILVPLILTFAFYFILKGFRTKNIWNFVAGGAIYGLGFHTYISFRLSVLLLFLVFLFFLISYLKQKQSKRFFLFTACFLVFTFIIALPMGIYFLQNPQDFIGRATGVSVFSQENPIKLTMISTLFHLGMFNIIGDPNWRHNFSSSPQLFFPIGILFLLGLFASVKRLIKPAHFILVSWLLIMLLPGILTFEGIPHSLRTIGAIIPAYILAGLGAEKFFEFLGGKIGKKLSVLFLIVFVFFVSGWQFNKYFISWAKNPEVAGSFEKTYTEIGTYLNSLPENTEKYVIVNELGSPLYGISIPAQSVMFIEMTKFKRPRATYIKSEDVENIEIGISTEIIPLYQKGIFERLESLFPEGKIVEKDSFKIYKIENK